MRQSCPLIGISSVYLQRNEVKNMLRNAEKAYVLGEISNTTAIRTLCGKSLGSVCRAEKLHSQYIRRTLRLWLMVSMLFLHPLVPTSQRHQSPLPLKLTFLYWPYPLHLKTPDEFFFQPVSCGQVRKVVESFPSYKAPGRDKVSMAVIKDALPCTLPTLTEIVNRSLRSSVFPSCWKE